MTTPENNLLRKQQIQRMLELSNLAKKRYLDVGGDPYFSVGTLHNNDTLTNQEKEEFLQLANQVFNDKDIADYLKKNGTWQDKLALLKARQKAQ